MPIMKRIVAKGHLSKLFAVAANAGAISAIKLTTAAALSLNPVSLGTVGTLAAAAIATGAAIGAYKTIKSGGGWRDFARHTAVHAGLGILGGGAALAITEYMDEIKAGLGWLSHIVSPYTSPIVSAFKGALNIIPPAYALNDYTFYKFFGEPLQTNIRPDNNLLLSMPKQSVLMNAEQSHILMRIICGEMDNCTFDNTYIPPAPQAISVADLPDNTLDITASTECDVSCANGEAGINCINITSKLPSIGLSFDMEQASAMLSDYCDEHEYCSFTPQETVMPSKPPVSVRIPQVAQAEVATPTPELEPTPEVPAQAIITPLETEPSVVMAPVIEPTTYAVKRGDNLWSIAKRLYGDGEKYRQIVQANIEKYPDILKADIIFPGMKLILPDADALPAMCTTGNVPTGIATKCLPAPA